MAERMTADEALEHFQTSLAGDPETAREEIPAVERFVAWLGAGKGMDTLTADEVTRYASAETDKSLDAVEPVRKFLAYAHRLSLTDDDLSLALSAPAATVVSGTAARRARMNASNNLGDSAYQVTLEGLTRLEQQLVEERAKRPYIAEKLREAMADKDFRENAPLDAARDEQAHLEARIRDLEARLRSAVIIDEDSKGGRANVGSVVKLLNISTNKEQSFTLVSPNEVDPSQGKISIASPVGVAVMNHKTGDEVTVNAPSGPLTFKVLDVQGWDRDLMTASIQADGTVITARGLVKRYGEITALNGVSFEVARGEIFGILGPNGAGKTTLVEILEGLTRPSSGGAAVLGLEVTDAPTAVKQRIGVQLQASSYHQYLTLREILELFGSFYERRVDPIGLLRRVHLEDRANTRMRTLSGGMQQRFSIVAALVNDPEVVFFDEPTAGLDPDARRDLWAIVREVRASGATVVLTTHYMEEAETLCDRVAFLHRGQVAALDTPQGLIRSLHAPYRVTFTTSSPLDASAVEAIPGATRIEQERTADGFVLRLRAEAAPPVVSALTSLVERTGVEMVDLAVEPATLEDVFLSVTGTGLGE